MRISSFSEADKGESRPRELGGIPLKGETIADHVARSRCRPHSELGESPRRLIALHVYAALLASSSLVLLVLLPQLVDQNLYVLPTFVMAAFSLLSERESVRVTANLEVSVAFLPTIFTVVALGPEAGMIVAVAGLLGSVGRPWARWLIWTGSRAVVAASAAFAASATTSTRSLPDLFIRVAVASLITTLGDCGFGAVTVWLRRSGAPLAFIREGMQIAVLGMLVYVPVIAGLVYLYDAVSLWAVVLFAGPALAAQRFFVLYRGQAEASLHLREAIAKLERMHLSFSTALVTALDARDHYTAGHSAAVAVYARDTAERMGLPAQDQGKAHLCGLLHDIGKIGIATDLLEKGGPLTREERAAIEMHSEIGAAILDRVEGYEDIADAVRHHHERFDGRGYPSSLAGHEIPVLARIVAVADSYSAMTSERPYRKALSRLEATTRLEQEAGHQLDGEIVGVFLQLLGEATEDYARGQEEDFEGALRVLAQEARPALVAI